MVSVVASTCGAEAVSWGPHFRQAEVQQFHRALGGQKDVGGLDVPMDEASGMSGIESPGDLDPGVHHHIGGERRLTQAIVHSCTFQILDHQIGPAIPFADVMQRADVVVIQGSDRTGLAFEASHRVLRLTVFVVKELECDSAAES